MDKFSPQLYKTRIEMPQKEMFLGIKIYKKECISECVGFEKYITKDGREIDLLVFKCVFIDGTIGIRKLSLCNFTIGNLPSKKGKND